VPFEDLTYQELQGLAILEGQVLADLPETAELFVVAELAVVVEFAAQELAVLGFVAQVVERFLNKFLYC
jgi:hypothetical protein